MNSSLLVLSRADVEQCLPLLELRARLRRAFIAFSEGRASVPPRVAATTSAGLLAAMPGNVEGVAFGLKAVTVFPGNHGGPLPSHQGLIVLFDETNGAPLAVMDASRITEVRTALSAAIGVDLGARADATSLAIIGAGALGREHLRVLQGIRRWTDVRVASRDADRADALASTYPGARRLSFEEAVRGADVVCLCTDAETPVIDHAWLSPGAHVSSVGRGAELPAATVAAAMAGGGVLVEWRGAALNPPPAGAHELQGLDAAAMIELGEALAGRAQVRRDTSAITVYKSTGHAMEDMAAASVVLQRAEALGLGLRVPI